MQEKAKARLRIPPPGSLWLQGTSSCNPACAPAPFTRGDSFTRIIVNLQGYFTNKYVNIWGHMKALHLLFYFRYGEP